MSEYLDSVVKDALAGVVQGTEDIENLAKAYLEEKKKREVEIKSEISLTLSLNTAFKERDKAESKLHRVQKGFMALRLGLKNLMPRPCNCPDLGSGRRAGACGLCIGTRILAQTAEIAKEIGHER